MTTATTAPSPDPAAPTPKTPMPPLDTRAPRPPVVRLRRSVVTALVMGGAGLVAGSFAWAFVVQPELRANDHARRESPAEIRGAVRPSERVTDAPANYAQLDRLPEPRRLGTDPDGAAPDAARPAPPPRKAVPRSRAVEAAGEARRSELFFADAGRAGPKAPVAGDGLPGAQRDYAAIYNTHDLLAPLSPYEIKAGAALPAALLTAIDTSRAGPVVATVTENVFDTVTGRHLLLPQGSRLLGRHEGESRHGDTRAVIVWDRLILPNGKSLVLSAEPGVDAQGAVGVKGRVDRRLLPLAVATVFAGAITTLGQAARDRDDDAGGLLGDAGDAAAIEAAQVGGKLIDRELEVRPTIRLRQGARVRVLITRDLILEPYR
jgi:type IV secretion system protein VirB10